MKLASNSSRRRTKTIDKQVFFYLGEADNPGDMRSWTMILRSLSIRTRVFKYGSSGMCWTPLFGPDYEIWCNLKDFRKALKKNNTSFRGFLLEFGAKIYSGSVRLPGEVNGKRR
jgi:hypothetical protein